MSDKQKLDMIFKYLDIKDVSEIEEYLEDASLKDYKEFKTDDEIKEGFGEYLDKFYEEHSYKVVEDLKCYTGINYKEVNDLLRGKWSYEKNGLLTDEKKEKMKEVSKSISKSIFDFKSVDFDFKTYRGCSLTAFKSYKVSSIEDLKNLEGSYYLDSGFVSTSLIKERSFFDRPLEFHSKCNILIEYYIPSECNDGIALTDTNLSYSPVQSEYLLDSMTLTKIGSVEISEDKTKAYIKMIVIPKKIWNKGYEKEYKEAYSA